MTCPTRFVDVIAVVRFLWQFGKGFFHGKLAL